MGRMPRRHLLSTLFVCASLCSFSANADINDTGVKIKWGYVGNKGPALWGSLDPHFVICSSGKTQSPINITRKVIKAKSKLVLNYQSAPIIIGDDVETELMLGDTQTIIDDGHGIQLNFHPEQTKEYITYEGKDYSLIQFHLHSPSENQWHGQSYPMEIHFVHQGAGGQVAVIGVFVKAGKENIALQKIINNLPKASGKAFTIQGETINPIDLVPVKQEHYDFVGSLTTPPCTEGLQWMMMVNPITATPAQIVQLRKAAGGANARPVQPLNGRVISYSAGTPAN